MFRDTKKFNKEISAIKTLEHQEPSLLHPLIKENIKQRMLSSVLNETHPEPKSFVWQDRKAKFFKYLVSVLAGFSLLGGTALAANNSKPGDVLFPIKKAEEKIALKFAASEQAKAALEVKFADRRLKELKEIQVQIQADQTVNPNSGNSTSTKKRNPNAHKKAEAQAQAEISTAITALTKTQGRLEAKNNTAAASSVQTTLLKLKTRENSFKHRNKNNDDHQSEQNNPDVKVELKTESDGTVKMQDGNLKLNTKTEVNSNLENK